AADVPFSDGTDTLLNIEQLAFSDGVTIPVPKPLNTVPNVIGLARAAAATAIVNAGLTVGAPDVLINSPAVHIGQVAATDPFAGCTLPPFAPVRLTVSLGTIVPTVTGLPLGDIGVHATALNALNEAGLVGVVTTTQPSTTVAAGSVISQAVAAGTTLDIGLSVGLVVSSGVPVPNVVGLTQAAATTSLTGAGLTVGTPTFSPS